MLTLERFPSYAHQRRELEEHADSPQRFLDWFMQAGKTKACIDKAYHLFYGRKIRSVIVVAPNGVHANWGEIEIPLHAWCGAPAVYVWSTKASKAAYQVAFGLVEQAAGLAWFVFSTSALRLDRVKALMRRAAGRGPALLVVDEAHHFKQPGASRTRALMAVARRCPWKVLLSGTPLHQSPLDAYSQFELFGKAALGCPTKREFDARYAVWYEARTKAGRTFPKVSRYQRLDELRERMAPYRSLVRREECPDVPELAMREVRFALGPGQRAAYHAMPRLSLEVEGRARMDFDPDTPVWMKQHQVTSGFVRGPDGAEAVALGCNARLEAFRAELGRSYGRLVVWAVYRYDLDRAAEALSAGGWRVMHYHGRSSEAEKRAARHDFRTGSQDDPVALVAHPESAGEGLTLASARGIIWYSMGFKVISWVQANERLSARRDGGKVPVVYLVADKTVDDDILAARAQNLDLAAYLAGSAQA